MDRDFGAELDEIKAELKKLYKMLTPSSEKEGEGNENGKRVEPIRNMHPDSRLSGMMTEMCTHAEESGVSGLVTYMGVFSSGGRQANWIKNEVNADDLLRAVEDRTPERVLACVGSNERLNILIALLKKPMTVAEIVKKCGFGSTGQAYHHMKPLLAAGIIAEGEEGAGKGVYVVRFDKVRGIIMLLAGICELATAE